MTVALCEAAFALRLRIVGYAYPDAETADSADLLDGTVSVQSTAFGRLTIEQPVFLAARGQERACREVERLLTTRAGEALVADAERRLEAVIRCAPTPDGRGLRFMCGGRLEQGAGVSVQWEEIEVGEQAVTTLLDQLLALCRRYPSRYDDA
jgi:hypothetical protein